MLFKAGWWKELGAWSASRAVCQPRVGPSELRSRRFHLYLYISDDVRHDVIQRWRQGAFLFLGNIRLKAISNSHQWPKHSWRAVFSSSAKQCLLSVNLKPFLMQTEQQTQERRIVNPRRGRFDTEKSSGAKNADLKFNGARNKDGWRIFRFTNFLLYLPFPPVLREVLQFTYF